MQLLNNFFTILEKHTSDAGLVAQIRLNPDHIVYTGHFPGFPVTPGVVQLQMVMELLEFHLGKKLKLRTMSQCKFLQILNPEESAQLTVHIEYQETEAGLRVNASGRSGERVYFKLNATFEV